MTWRDRQRHRQMTGTQSSLRGCNCLKTSFVVNVKIKKYIYIYFNWKKRSKPHRTTRSFSKKAAVDHFNIKDFLKGPASKTGWVINIATCQVHTSCFPWGSRRNAKTKNSVQIYSYPFWCFSFLSPNSADKHSRPASTAYRQMAWIGKLWTKSYRGNLTWHHKHCTMTWTWSPYTHVTRHAVLRNLF